jgi:hypothetical protein
MVQIKYAWIISKEEPCFHGISKGINMMMMIGYLVFNKVSKLIIICCQRIDTGDCLLQRVRMPMTVCCVMCMQSKEADDGLLCLMESRCQCWSAA